MNIETTEYNKILTPTDSANVLCNGSTYGRRVVIPLSVSETDWREMTEAEAEALCSEEEATEEDYQLALNALGVDLNAEE